MKVCLETLASDEAYDALRDYLLDEVKKKVNGEGEEDLFDHKKAAAA